RQRLDDERQDSPVTFHFQFSSEIVPRWVTQTELLSGHVPEAKPEDRGRGLLLRPAIIGAFNDDHSNWSPRGDLVELDVLESDLVRGADSLVPAVELKGDDALFRH